MFKCYIEIFSFADWNRFLYEEMDSWYRFNLQWLNYPRSLHVILFNQLKQNTSSEMVALLKFLNISISNKERLCVVRNVDGHFKRPGTFHNYSGTRLFKYSVEQTLNGYWNNIIAKVKKRQLVFNS